MTKEELKEKALLKKKADLIPGASFSRNFEDGFSDGFDAGYDAGAASTPWVAVEERLPDASLNETYLVTVYADGSDYRNGNQSGVYVTQTVYGLCQHKPSWGAESHAERCILIDTNEM